MNTITNISRVSVNSGETPVVTYSNPVTTIVRQTPPTPIITRFFYRFDCCCGCRCNSDCGCCCGC